MDLASMGSDGWALILLFVGVAMFFALLYGIGMIILGAVSLIFGKKEEESER